MAELVDVTIGFQASMPLAVRVPKKAHVEGRWIGIYLGWMRWCLRHRVLTTIGALIFFFGSLALVPLLPTGFIPPDDNSQTQVYLELRLSDNS